MIDKLILNWNMLTDQQIEQIKEDLKEVIFDIETQKFFESYNHLVTFMSNIKIWDETNFYEAITDSFYNLNCN